MNSFGPLDTLAVNVYARAMGYLGSKAVSGAYQAIIALMPPHDTYIELFAGSAAVLKRKPPAANSYVVDRAAPECLGDVSTIDGLTVCPVDAFDFLGTFDYAAGGRVIIYADPPYLHSTRGRARYKFDMTDADHLRLLTALRAVSARGVHIILSGYPSALYDSHLTNWHSRQFQAMTRGGPRTEQLWFNFNPNTAVAWASTAGANFTDRQRIKRKAARWAKNYVKLSAGERLAVLSAVLEADADSYADRRPQPSASIPADVA